MTDGMLGTTLSGRMDSIGETGHADASPFARLVLGAIESANAILAETSRDVECETAQLSELFNRLSDHSQDQVDQLTDLTGFFETALDAIFDFMRPHPARLTDGEACSDVSREIVDAISLSDVRSVYAEESLDGDVDLPAAVTVTEDSSSGDGRIVLF